MDHFEFLRYLFDAELDFFQLLLAGIETVAYKEHFKAAVSTFKLKANIYVFVIHAYFTES